MGLTLITGPEKPPVALEAIKAHLRIDATDEDLQLADYLDAARLHLEGKDGWLGRALITQTWDWTLDAFPLLVPSRGGPAALIVPLPPLRSVTHVKYLDGDGVLQTLDPSGYVVDATSEPGRIVPSYGTTWPTTRTEPNAVTVRFIAGYGEDARSVPAAIRQALIGVVSDFYEHRAEATAFNVTAPNAGRPGWVESQLWPYRIWRNW